MKKNISKSNNKHKQEQLLPIIGIGASAGGLNALKKFFSKVPKDSGLVYVVVVHLSPEHKSLLADLLQQTIKMPAIQVTENVELKPNHVYVIPPNANLDTIDTHLRPSKLEEKRSERAPIDHFFRTLARTHEDSAIGIILTGTGSDGTLGLKEIKEKGGLTIVQEPMEAEYDGMPQSAISTGLVDLVLPLAEMPDYIMRYTGTRPRLKFIEEGEKPDKEDKALIQRVFAQVKARTGRDFSRYKLSTIMRRLQRRMQIYQMEELEEYLELLRKNPEEVRALSDDFLINVTNFFRDANVFSYLESNVIPNILKKKNGDDEVRIWSVGCASGEEAYSLAILLAEAVDEMESPPSIQIFASDLHETSLKKAREGFFPGDIHADVSRDRLRRFFNKDDGGFRIRKELREQVVFTPHNLLSDPPFSRLDMVVCRNLLIYLQRDVQKDIFELFHYALLPSAYMVLGTSESQEANELFRTVSKELSVFRKKNINGPEPRLPVFPRINKSFHEKNKEETMHPPVSQGVLHQKLVERYGPPSLLLSPDYQVIHVSENAGRYLRIQGGELSRDLFKLVRTEFSPELRSILHLAKEEKKTVRSKPIDLQIEGKTQRLIISVRMIEEQPNENMFLVMFEEYEVREKLPTNEIKEKSDAVTPKRIEELEDELSEKRQQLQSVIEEYETSREEMKASNEELQSSNEELRSTMEELETSKEELQSVNEELTTLNQENRHKVEELSQMSDDLQNLLASTQIATLFLNREFRIMRYTPILGELFNIRPADRGRQISDITNKMNYDALESDATKVIKKLQPVEKEIQDNDGNTYLTRILPYRSSDDKIGGVVITFIDISGRKNDEEELRLSKEKYHNLFNSIDEGFCIFEVIFNENDVAVDYRFLETNPAFEKHTGIKDSEGKQMLELAPDHESHWFEIYGRIAKTGKSERFVHRAKHIGNRWFDVYAFRVGRPQEKKVAAIFTDISEKKMAEKELQQAKETAEKAARAKEEFLAHMSHEIRTPLNAIVGFSHLLMEQEHSDDQHRSLNIMHNAAGNLNRLINDILDLSKIQAGKISAEPEPNNLHEFFRDTLTVHRGMAQKKGISLKHQLDEKIPALLNFDRSKLSHVLHNLLSNAVKFTEKGEVKLNAELKQQEKNNIWIEFSVTDTGIGIEKNKLKEIFDVFRQADASTVRKYGGTGLGLTIAKLYLEMMGSKIMVESQPGKGSRFFFVLPVSLVKEKKEKPQKVASEKISLDHKRVLVVEDDDYNRVILEQLFDLWELPYVSVTNGKEAVKKAGNDHFNLILMDIRMPEMDGYEATRRIRKIKNYKNIPVVVLTADVSQKVQDEVKQGMFTDIVIKPVQPDDLKARLRQLLAEK